MRVPGTPVSRRGFLGLAAAGTLLGTAGCSVCPAPPAGPSRPRAEIVPAASAVAAFRAEGALASPGESGPFTISELLAAPSFFVAHRGSGDNWPEHTMKAYQSSVDAGLKAIEVSVSSTREEVLVCHHDLNAIRLTGIDLTIPRASYAAVESLRNDARAWLGPATPLEPIPLLTDVLDAFAATHVIFLEDKPGTNADEILALLEGYPDARNHIVWKQPASSPGHALAAARGYKTFGYMTSREKERVAELAPRVDILGVHHSAPEAMIREMVASGKPVAAWEVHRRSEHAHLLKLGVRGFICSNIRNVLHLDEPHAEDSFADGRRGTGDLPWAADAVWDEQPAFVDGAVRISSEKTSGYVLGSMAGSVDAPEWELAFELRWPERIPAGPDGAGVAFGQDGDGPYRAGDPRSVAGYHLDFAADGTMTLYRQDGGTAPPVSLAHTASPAPNAGEWISFVVSVSPGRIAARRAGDGTQNWTAESDDVRYGGVWHSLLKNYIAGPAVEFRRVRLTGLTAKDSCSTVE